MLILGLSFYYHDSAACLIGDGRVIAAAEEERFSRIKHDNRFPHRAVQFCLSCHRVTSQEIDYVVFYEKPGLKLDRVISTLGRHFPRSRAVFSEIFGNWGREKLWVSEIIQARLKVPKRKVLFSEHHLSHAASAFYCSPFKTSAVLTVDGVGEWITSTMGTAQDNLFARDSVTLFPHSLGLLYSAFTAFLGFEVNEGEYKVMGLAPYGEPKYTDEVRRLFTDISLESFELDMEYFAYEYSSETSYTPRFLSLFGEPRKPEEPFFLPRYAREIGGDRTQTVPSDVVQRSQRFADIAASVQVVIEDVLLGFAQGLQRRTGLTDLCMAGGVAYNSVANGRILREAGFKRVYIQPAAGDSGASIGGALAAYHSLYPRTSPSVMDHAYWGRGYLDDEVREILERNSYAFYRAKSDEDLTRRVARFLAEGKVIGWFQGRFEFGPRALGNRSILADPRSIQMKEVVNARVKFRELFRPFAPACAQSHANIYFDCNRDSEQLPYRFMLCVVPVQCEYHSQLEAITHVDGSARIQVVSPETNPLFHQLIEAFGEITGVYALLNTSFNRRGEPIVGSPQDALTTFEWSAIDVLVMGPFMVVR